MAVERDKGEDCACQKARVAARALTRAYDCALRRADLRASQYAVLVAIETHGAMSITVLASALGMDRTTLSRNLRPLEKDGLIALGLEGRGRTRAFEVTKKGKARLREALPLWKQAQETLRRSLGDRDWANVHDVLDRLILAV
jgi:DNA-binding MarR family transcriptional regulator